MFIGHFAVGFAAKRVAPKVSLGWLLAAPLLLDLVWPVMLLVGLESVRIDPGNTAFTPLDLHDYPYTHGLAMAPLWALLLGGVYWARRRDRRGALVVAAGVASHWLLDFVTHRPDMPLYPGSAILVGLGLWNSKIGTVIVEAAMSVIGVALYARSTRAANRKGAIALWSLVGLLIALYVAVVLGPPPPGVNALIGGAFLSWLFVPWAWWADRNRVARSGNGAG